MPSHAKSDFTKFMLSKLSRINITMNQSAAGLTCRHTYLIHSAMAAFPKVTSAWTVGTTEYVFNLITLIYV